MATQGEDKETHRGYVLEEFQNRDVKTDMSWTPQIIWPRVIFHGTVHLLGIYGGYLCFFYVGWMTFTWTYILGLLTGQAITVGAHRGYSHKSFKMSTSLQIFLLAFETMAGQNSMYTWARDHRLHHKYSDTDADPHNINRGFFFAHVGWLLTTKHPLVKEKGQNIDVSDLTADKLVMMQHKYYVPFYVVVGILVPILVPMYGWNETFVNSFLTSFCMRYILVLNITWSINSVAHTFGTKSYDRRIRAVQSKFVWVMAFGEGWHNFHHTFPWDYRTTDVGVQGASTKFIELLARWGFLYDLKTASSKVINGHTKRHGDGTHANIRREKNSEGLTNVARLLSINFVDSDEKKC